MQAAIDQYGSNIKFASFDHISGYPSAILPIKQLVSLCHQHNIVVMVDGAHAMGQIPLNITDIDADFYISDGHKWLYSPKGIEAAVLMRHVLFFDTTDRVYI